MTDRCAAAVLGQNAAANPNNLGSPFWAPSAAAVGGLRIDPAQLAQELIATLHLHAITIGMTPHAGPDRIGTVGAPIWLWVQDPQPTTTGPLHATRTTQGITVSLTANLTSIDWDMGDGTTEHCTGTNTLGTPYQPSDDLNPSPTCGHTYTHQGNPYTITATSHWTITWTAAGTNGTIPLTLTTSTTRRIGELQALTIN